MCSVMLKKMHVRLQTLNAYVDLWGEALDAEVKIDSPCVLSHSKIYSSQHMCFLFQNFPSISDLITSSTKVLMDISHRRSAPMPVRSCLTHMCADAHAGC